MIRSMIRRSRGSSRGRRRGSCCQGRSYTVASYKVIEIGKQKDEIANETIKQQIESQTIRVNCHKKRLIMTLTNI